MGFWNNIKNFFSFRKNKTMALPEPQSNQDRYDNDNSITLTRLDGSEFSIQPRLDRVGNQCFKEVIHARTGERHLIPEFVFTDLTSGDFKGILMEIDFQQLKSSEEYKHQVANVLLSQKRIPEIFNKNENYAGTVELNQDGRLVSKCSKNIINGLSNIRRQAQEIYSIKQKEWERNNSARIQEEALKIPLNIKTSHAENLKKYTYEDDGR